MRAVGRTENSYVMTRDGDVIKRTLERTSLNFEPDGVALAAIQGLNQKLTEELKRRDAENTELKRQLNEIEMTVRQLAAEKNKQP
jgi:hypothetical protein